MSGIRVVPGWPYPGIGINTYHIVYYDTISHIINIVWNGGISKANTISTSPNLQVGYTTSDNDYFPLEVRGCKALLSSPISKSAVFYHSVNYVALYRVSAFHFHHHTTTPFISPVGYVSKPFENSLFRWGKLSFRLIRNW